MRETYADTTRSYGVLLAIALASGMALITTHRCRLATEPGTSASPRDDVTWSGGPFFAPNPAGCVRAADPACDHFIVRIENPRVKRVLVAIAPAMHAHVQLGQLRGVEFRHARRQRRPRSRGRLCRAVMRG